MTGDLGRRSPTTRLPLAYFAVAAAAFTLAALAVPGLSVELAGHYYHPRVLALTHTVGLGWATLAIMGATYQLLPIVLERPVWSPRLARWQLVVLGAGILGMVSHFWLGKGTGLAWAAGLSAAGIGGHVLNVGLSLRGLPRWTFTARCVVVGVIGLSAAALAGGLLAAERVWPGLVPADRLALVHAHFHLALLGWIAPMVIGVAPRLLAMFLLAPEPSDRALGRLQLWGLLLGVPGVVAGLLGVPGLLAVAALLVGLALATHLRWVLGMARTRRRPELDWGLRFALTGAAGAVPAVVMGGLLAVSRVQGPRPALGYAVLALGGWISLSIVGIMLKIVPFLVWYHAYAGRVGREPVPTMAQLGWPRAEGVSYVLLTAGLPALAVAAWSGSRASIRVAGVVVAAGALAFAAALSRVLAHLVRPGQLRGVAR